MAACRTKSFRAISYYKMYSLTHKKVFHYQVAHTSISHELSVPYSLTCQNPLSQRDTAMTEKLNLLVRNLFHFLCPPRFKKLRYINLQIINYFFRIK
jgi:hypothetical protein